MPSLTPNSLAALAKAKSLPSYERGQGYELLRLGDRLVYVSHINNGPPTASDAVFVFSSLTMKDRLVLDDELILKDTSVSSVMLRGDTIWVGCTQGKHERILAIVASAAGKLKLAHTYAIKPETSLVDIGDVIALKHEGALQVCSFKDKLEKLGEVEPEWKSSSTGFSSAAVHAGKVVILGIDRAGIQVFDISNPKAPAQLAAIPGNPTGPDQIRWFDDGYVVSHGRSKVADIYRGGPDGEWTRLGRIKTANNCQSMLRVDDVCFFYNGNASEMKNPDKDSRRIDMLQLGEKPSALPAVSLAVPVQGMAVTGAHLHVLGDDRIATFALT